MGDQDKPVPLTAKQQETVDLLLQGHNAKQIAKITGITPSAATQRIEGLLRKTGSRDRGELIRWQQARLASQTAEESQVGLSTDTSPRSTTERITADLDRHSGEIKPMHGVPIVKMPDPETRVRKEYVRTRIEWLGSEVTWLQMILLLVLLTGISLIRH
jgi:DNA-binding CsgD family transcriptional regulator